MHPGQWWHASPAWSRRCLDASLGQTALLRGDLGAGLSLTRSRCRFDWDYRVRLRHDEPVCMLVFGESGVSRFSVNGMTWTVRPGDVWWWDIPDGALSRHTPADQLAGMTVLKYSRWRLANALRESSGPGPGRSGVRRLARGAQPGAWLDPLVAEPLDSTSSRLRAEALSLDLLSRWLSPEAPSRPGNLCLTFPLQRVCDYLLADLAHTPSLDELAALSGMSHVRLNREFRRHLGTTVFDWLRRQRLQRAAWMLDASDRSVTDIALDCGFSHASHFAQQFRRDHGCSPGVYRRLKQE